MRRASCWMKMAKNRRPGISWQPNVRGGPVEKAACSHLSILIVARALGRWARLLPVTAGIGRSEVGSLKYQRSATTRGQRTETSDGINTIKVAPGHTPQQMTARAATWAKVVGFLGWSVYAAMEHGAAESGRPCVIDKSASHDHKFSLELRT
jgi:hypothetical protein